MKRKEWIKLAVMVGGFAVCLFLPAMTLETGRVGRAAAEALGLTRWYARAHVLLCLVPAFFIAGAISVFVSQASVAGALMYFATLTEVPIVGGLRSSGMAGGPPWRCCWRARPCRCRTCW